MPCHHNLETYLCNYIERCGLTADPAQPLFCTITRFGRRASPRICRTAAPWRRRPMANHASIRTTQLYDRRRLAVSLDEVERVAI